MPSSYKKFKICFDFKSAFLPLLRANVRSYADTGNGWVGKRSLMSSPWQCFAVCTFLFGSPNNNPPMLQCFLTSQNDLPRLPYHICLVLPALGLTQEITVIPEQAGLHKARGAYSTVQLCFSLVEPQPSTTPEAADNRKLAELFLNRGFNVLF